MRFVELELVTFTEQTWNLINWNISFKINFLVLDCGGDDFLELLLHLFVSHPWSEFMGIPCYICWFSRLFWFYFGVCYRIERSLHFYLLYFYLSFNWGVNFFVNSLMTNHYPKGKEVIHDFSYINQGWRKKYITIERKQNQQTLLHLKSR
jgi:hypothetical protein